MPHDSAYSLIHKNAYIMYQPSFELWIDRTLQPPHASPEFCILNMMAGVGALVILVSRRVCIIIPVQQVRGIKM